jgi:XRE family transcriptional regulator, regulator of sulfur utilization
MGEFSEPLTTLPVDRHMSTIMYVSSFVRGAISFAHAEDTPTSRAALVQFAGTMKDIYLLYRTPMPLKRNGESGRVRTLPTGDNLGAVEVAQRVAGNLRALRRKRDLSLDELAQRTGVSRAGLSQIETSKTNPTLGVLWKIASGLGVPFAELLGETQPQIAVLRRKDVPVLRSTDRRFESRPLMPSAAGNQVEFYELRLAPNTKHASDAHGAGTRELVLVVSGCLRLVAGERIEDLQPGDSMIFNANVPHVYENPGDSEARYHDLIMYPVH